MSPTRKKKFLISIPTLARLIQGGYLTTEQAWSPWQSPGVKHCRLQNFLK